MLRVVVTIVLPLLLPTALYLGWVWLAQSTMQSDGAVRWSALPWLWLAGTGVVLLAVVLVVIAVGFGTASQGVYVPPHWVNGHIVPAHVEPEPAK